MKIYTRTGDNGSTGLFGGPRVAKDEDRIEAYGSVDELNAAIGLVRSALTLSDVDQQLASIQNDLFAVGAELATPDPDAHHVRMISATSVGRLENWIDELEQELPPLKQFILPGGTPAASQLHLARAICRRAERRVVTLVRRHEVSISEELLSYLNRLSDLLFVQARVANARAQTAENPWQKPQG